MSALQCEGVWAQHARNMHVYANVWVCAYICVCAVHVPASFVQLSCILPPSGTELWRIHMYRMYLPLKVLHRQPKLLLTRLLRRNHISATFWQPLLFTYTRAHTHSQRHIHSHVSSLCVAAAHASRVLAVLDFLSLHAFFCSASRHVFTFSKFHGITTLKRFHKVQPQQVARLHVHVLYICMQNAVRVVERYASSDETYTY